MHPVVGSVDDLLRETFDRLYAAKDSDRLWREEVQETLDRSAELLKALD